MAEAMTERERERAIRVKLARSESRFPAFVPTGFEALDRALAGGLPRGRITELFGGPSGGKTTLALEIVAHVQENGLSAAWIDAEHGFDPAYASDRGVSLERLPMARPDTAEESLEIARQLAGSGGIDLLALDSAAALTPALELEIGLGDGAAGLQSRILASGFRRLAFAAARTETAILVLNQVRSRSGASDAETTAGGPALKLQAAVRISLEHVGGPFGVRFRVLKSKMGDAFREGELRLDGGHGRSKTP
jgi:recombination protein RecA